MPGADMVETLKASPPSDVFLLPGAAFNEDGVTLDGMSPGEIAGAAGRENVMATDDIVRSVLELTGGAAPNSEADGPPRRGNPEKEGR